MFYGKEILYFCGYWQMIMFLQLLSTLILVDHDTRCVGKIISLSFLVYKKCQNRRSYALCALI
jgi:hypothetical protein